VDAAPHRLHRTGWLLPGRRLRVLHRADPHGRAGAHRGELAYVILNLYPYNSGHLLVVPYRHVATYDSATPDEVAEVGKLTQVAMRVLSQVSRADGFNIGMNQGAIAGAGIAAHLHQHIVPRWATDANFFPIIARTKAIPRLLGEVRDEIAAAWPS
jgi:ATP adenylyltransferase